jgi:broad specificity phosphatase PhoE
MATVLAVRHGIVENPDNVIYARLPGFRLSEAGRHAAGELAATLGPAAIREIWASPLERAQETAKILAAPHGLEVKTDERLIEWSFWTQWQGTPWMSVREQAPHIFDSYADDPGSLCPEDPLEAVGARVLEWSGEVAAGDGIVLGVSHEAPLAAAYLVGSGTPIARFAGTHVPHLGAVRLQPAPAEILEIGMNGLNLGAE